MEQLGVNSSLLLAQIVNFLIIIFVLTKLLYKPVLDMLEKRKKEIEAGLALTEKMREEKEKLDENAKKIIEKTRKDAQLMFEDIKKDAQKKEKEILEEAQTQAKQIKVKAKHDTQTMHEEMIKDLEKDVVNLAGAMAAKITSKILSKSDQQKLIGMQLSKLTKNKG